MKVPLLQEPVDKWRVAYIICFLQGLGMLFPWNTFITASAYYESRLCDTSFHHNFENFFGISFNVMNSLGCIIALLYQNRIRQRYRVLVPLGMCTLVFGVTTLLVTIDSLDGNTLFGITIVCVVVAALNISLLQGGVFGLVAQLPPIYTQAVMGGQGLAGAGVSVVSIITTYASSSSSSDDDSVCTSYTTDWASFAYFFVSCTILASSFFGYFVLERLPFVLYYTRGSDGRYPTGARSSINSTEGDVVVRSDDAAPLMQTVDDPEADEDPRNSPLRASVPLSTTPKLDSFSELDRTKSSDNIAAPPQKSGPSSRTYAISRRMPSESQDNDEETLSPQKKTNRSAYEDEPTQILTNKEVFYRVRSLALGVGYVFLITLCLFPSVASKLASSSNSSNRFFDDLWTPFLFLMFNFWDLIGRAILAPWKTIIAPEKLWIGAAFRTIFVPLFLLCNLSSPANNYVLFDNDACPIIFMSLFGLTNGYLSAQLMMYGPIRVGDMPENQQKAGTMMVLCLVLGLAVGAFSSFALLPATT